MAAAIAGILAALLSSIIEVLVMGGMPPASRLDAMLFVILAAAPVLEEGCKRGFSRLMAAPWGKVGLYFGIMEGLGKLAGLEHGSAVGFVISVMFHWGLGRHAEAGRWPLLAVSALILWASFQRPVDAARSDP